jgi:nicotinate phosphoribosyltransferase
MGVGALESLRYANRFALEKWAEVWKNPGIALSDTYGTKAFLKDFDYRLANLYDGTRHDSGDPYEYVNDIIKHYGKLGIDYSSKKITFSDNLNFEKMEKIHRYCFEQNIQCNFGIGTFLTNDFENTKPLNIVIKPFFINDIPVVKLGEGDGKVNGGSEEAIRYTKWVFGMQ